MDEIKIIKSNRKTVSVEINNKLEIIVRAPKKMEQREIERFIIRKEDWINKHLRIAKNRYENLSLPKFTKDEICILTKKAKEVIPKRIQYFTDGMGVSYERVSIRHQKSRWGSCSSKGNLNFNCLLMLCPEEILDSVIIHELCHLVHPNHSKDFWNMVEKFDPDYKIHRQWLKDNGSKLISRLDD